MARFNYNGVEINIQNPRYGTNYGAEGKIIRLETNNGKIKTGTATGNPVDNETLIPIFVLNDTDWQALKNFIRNVIKHGLYGFTYEDPVVNELDNVYYLGGIESHIFERNLRNRVTLRLKQSC